MGKQWGVEDKEKLKVLFPHYSNIELVKFFPGRTENSIKMLGSKLGFRKKEETLKRIKPECMRKAYEARRKNWCITKDGYVLVYAPDHPYANGNKHIFEHRLVMEQHLGRYLRKNEIVHHIDGNRRNNTIENLKLMTISEHVSLHSTGKIVSKETIEKANETRRKNYTREKHYAFKPITKYQLENAVVSSCSLSETIYKLGISYNTFYKRLEEFNLREWYKNVKPSCFGRKNSYFDRSSLYTKWKRNL